MTGVRSVTLLVCWLACIYSGSAETADENTYTTKVEYLDNDDDFQILDKDGHLVSSAGVYTEQGYELERPVDSNACLIRNLEDNDECFVESEQGNVLPDGVKDFCQGKEHRLLIPTACDDDGDDSEKTFREKRALRRNCRVERRPCRRVCGRRCCLEGSGRCIRSCNIYCPSYCTSFVCSFQFG